MDLEEDFQKQTLKRNVTFFKIQTYLLKYGRRELPFNIFDFTTQNVEVSLVDF